MGEQQHPGSGGAPRTEAVPPAVPGAQDSGVSTWEPGTAAGAAPDTPMPAPDPEAGENAGEEDITAIRAKISALQNEIDRLTALIGTAVKKLEG
jgi:hypothetical protein